MTSLQVSRNPFLPLLYVLLQARMTWRPCLSHLLTVQCAIWTLLHRGPFLFNYTHNCSSWFILYIIFLVCSVSTHGFSCICTIPLHIHPQHNSTFFLAPFFYSSTAQAHSPALLAQFHQL